MFLTSLGRKHIASFAAAALALATATTASAATHNPVDGTALSTLLNGTTLQMGDTIVLNAAATYTGIFTLPNKTGSGWITIQSSNLASLPAAGTRVNLTHAGNMPNLRPPDAGSSAIKTAPGAHHYKLIGLEIISFSNPATQITNDLIMFGDPAYTSTTQLPGNLVLDRCIVRADSDAQGIKRGIGLNSASTDIVDCYIAGFKMTGNGDTQCIGGWNGPGPYKIVNNYLEAAGENILFGGASIGIANNVPSDITIKKNHFYKKPEWNPNRTAANGFSPPLYAGTHWNTKNILEFKNGRRAVIEGNIFDNHWVDAQSGWSLVFTPRIQSGQAPWVVVEDIELSKNIVRNIAAGPNIAGNDQPFEGAGAAARTKRLKFVDNLFYNMGGIEFGNGKLFQSAGPIEDLTVNHQTAFQVSNIWSPGGSQSTGCAFMNSVYNHGQYGFKGPSTGNTCFNDYFSGPAGVIVQRNVMMDNSTYSLNTLLNFYNQYTMSWSPTSLAFPQTGWTGVLVNHASPGSNFAGWKVVNGSAYDNAGLKTDLTSDGRDVGVDIDALNAATAGCVSGVWPTALIAEDNFNYTGNLNGKSGGIGFGANAWAAVSGQANPVIASGSMSYTDGTHTLTIAGNKVQPANTSQSLRNFPATIPTANRTLWVSMRMNHTGTGTLPSNHAGISLFSSPNAGGTSLFLGKPGFGASNYGADHSGTWAQKAGGVSTNDRNAFLVYKLVFTSSQVTISMWINPILSESALGPSHMTPIVKAHTTGFASIRLSTGANATSFQFDEWRLGSGFQDVTD